MPARYLVEIKLRAVITEEEANVDRLLVDGIGTEGCPLNILGDLVRGAEERGDATNSCPYCGGRADARIIREATTDDEKHYTWARETPEPEE